MSSLLTALIVLALLATAGSLFGGLAAMGSSRDLDTRSERMMFTRVGLQAAAVVLVLLLLLLRWWAPGA